MQNYYKQFDTCREHDIPSCSDACPFKMDILTVQERITGGRLNAAYKSIRDCVVFPAIVSEICPAYCENACIRSAVDKPVQIRELERSVVANATRKAPNKYNLPAKKQKIAVIGGGISGMGFAFRMASKKYDVTVFEQKNEIGGHLADFMNKDVYMSEFELQFKNEKYNLELNREIKEISNFCKLKDDNAEKDDMFDVIYIATGSEGNTFGVPMPETGTEGGCMMVGNTALFIGGEVCGRDLMYALADGINIAASAEAFLRTGKMEYPADTEPTGCIADKEEIEIMPPTAAENGVFTEEECEHEAARCIRCRCDACIRDCDLVDYFDKMPVKMRDEIFLSCKPAGSLVHKSPARKYVAACTMCDLMTETCPEHIDLCGMVKYARHRMHDAGKVPEAYRQYFMRDMEFANSSYAALKKSRSGIGRYSFFPGCNIGALDPDYVIKPYKWLLEKEPDTSILLRCCSVPVDWNGDSELHRKELENLERDWIDLGRPVLIMACISCLKHINEYLPEIETISLYEIFEEWGFKKEIGSTDGICQYSVFDPCSARNKPDIQKSVRKLISDAGIDAEELPGGDRHGCCGFGGMGSVAAPGFSDYVAEKRCEISDDPYIVYCSNCRDIFCDRGKEAIHILDILFDIDPEGKRPQPDVTRRRENRVMLKKRLLKEIWHEEDKEEEYEKMYNLEMSDEVRKKVNRQKILEEDICEVISNAEKTGRRTLDAATGHYKAYKEIGYITCWVEYSPVEGGYEIYNLYTHRMKIELEAVWNGKKTDTDLR